jgi:O-Antigen ligase
VRQSGIVATATAHRQLVRRVSSVMGAAAVTALLVPATAAANGGYFATSWGWAALAGGWLACLGLLIRPATLRHGAVLLLGLAGLLVWSLVSAAWAPASDGAFEAAERLLVLVLLVLAFFAWVRRAEVVAATVALTVGIAAICVYALSTRLFADAFGSGGGISGYRLARPIGYWNGLGIYAALGLALGVGCLSRVDRLARALLGASVPLTGLTIYFTYSRGAAIAAGVALAVVFVLQTRRIEWLLRGGAVVLVAAIGVFVAARSPALTTAGLGVGRTLHEGHRLALLLVGLCFACALVACMPASWFAWTSSLERAGAVAVSLAAVTAAVAGLWLAGGPVAIAHKFESTQPTGRGALNGRLFSFSGTNRVSLWSVAVDEYRANPVLGGGAGTYEAYYLEHRSSASKVRNAHSLYLETLAELGPVGLVILLVALAAPLAAVPQARSNAIVPAAAGAYVALLVHLGVDWDWQLTGVAATGLICGAAILAAAAGEPVSRSPWPRRAVLAATVVGGLAAFVVLRGSLALGDATDAAAAGDWAASARSARTARRWMPWSALPWQVLGEAQLGLAERRVAVASFRHGLAKSPDDWSLWFDLARTETGRARTQALRRATRLNPRSPEIAELRSELADQGVIGVASP